MDIFYILLSITALFFVLLGARELFSKKLKEKTCVICTAVTLTWISLLILYWFNIFNNPIILAILIGETSLGIFYLVESKVKEELKLFRLPFLLTLILTGYLLISEIDELLSSSIFLLMLWIFFILLYSYKNNKSMNKFVKKIIECCKKW